ncbi:MAG: hypothetical protein U5R48_14170 [Gammaproteobacteria bacterium]|nr:hypothetical protein [Gammaproteobacteria bacterium]
MWIKHQYFQLAREGRREAREIRGVVIAGQGRCPLARRAVGPGHFDVHASGSVAERTDATQRVVERDVLGLLVEDVVAPDLEAPTTVRGADAEPQVDLGVGILEVPRPEQRTAPGARYPLGDM